MNQNMDEFLSIGLNRFKQATAVMISFEEEIQTRLQKILVGRSSSDQWGTFEPTAKATTKGSRTWKQYPHLSASIRGELRGTKVSVIIAVNWYQSETDYPFYEIYLSLPKGAAEEDPNETPLRSLKEFPPGRQVKHVHTWIDTLRLVPDEDDFNLERDFGILSDELVGFFDANIT